MSENIHKGEALLTETVLDEKWHVIKRYLFIKCKHLNDDLSIKNAYEIKRYRPFLHNIKCRI